tara:strand:+ start:383 stop:742 length:360 start_codon:yes stop_codon:yes gene_type:complete
MTTNDLKKGARIVLANGWFAEIYDNKKGNTRLVKVYGYETEIGSVYSFDILWAKLGDVPTQPAMRGRASQGAETARFDMEHRTDGPDDSFMGTYVTVDHTPKQLKLKASIAAMGLGEYA